MKALVVYYTRTGNTRKVAEAIAAACGGDLEEIREVDVRREGLRGWLYAGRDAMRKKTSEIEGARKHASDYDIVFVGSPVWAGNIAPAVRAYLSQADLGGRRLALFCTMGNSQGSALASMRELASSAKVAGELAIPQREAADADALRTRIAEWVAEVFRAA